MNARQKAKHFKKLYEQTKPSYKIIQFPKSSRLKHYAAGRVVMHEELCDFTEDMYFKCIVCPDLLDKFKDKLIENIEVETDERKTIYRLDIWLGK